MTILDLSEEYEISVSELKKRIEYTGIKGMFRGKNRMFKDSEIDLILMYDLTKYRHYKKFDKRKLTIFEFYLKFNNKSLVSRILGVTDKAINAVIKEYKDTGCLVIESKMNSAEKK